MSFCGARRPERLLWNSSRDGTAIRVTMDGLPILVPLKAFSKKERLWAYYATEEFREQVGLALAERLRNPGGPNDETELRSPASPADDNE